MLDSKKLFEIHQFELLMLEYIDQVFDANNIWYSLAYGSVLGSVRHNGFIPWDNDIDIYIRLEDINTIREVIGNNPSDKFKLYRYGVETSGSHDYLCFNANNNARIDFYPLIGVPLDYSKALHYIKRCTLYNRILRTKLDSGKGVRDPWLRKVVFWVFKFFMFFVPIKVIRRIFSHLLYKYKITDDGMCATIPSYSVLVPYNIIKNTTRHSFENLSIPIPENYKQYLITIYGTDYMTPKRR